MVGEMTPVSVVVPCRNERRYIEDFLRGVVAQEAEDISLEILVADGMSEDGTREIVREWTARDGRIILIDNTVRIVSTGLNAAIAVSRGAVIVRMDVHTDYAPDYLKQCVAVLKQTGTDNVGGPWRATGHGFLQEAIALAFQSPFSSGGAGSHRVDYEGPVDSVYLGCWRREVFERFGMFDEELVRNQDDEHNLRIVRGGGRLWQSPRIRSSYHPRDSLPSLFAQYAQYGYWKVRVIKKHRLPASLRHVVPGVFSAVLLLSLAMAPFSRVAAVVLGAAAGGYVIANLVASVATCARRAHWRFLPLMPAVLAAFHFGYGYGFLRGAWDFLVRRRGSDGFSRLTRG